MVEAAAVAAHLNIHRTVKANSKANEGFFRTKNVFELKMTKKSLTWKICELYLPQIFLTESSSDAGLSKTFYSVHCLATDSSEEK